MKIRTANKEEVNKIVNWAQQEGWNPGLNDSNAYLSADPNGFFVGYLDQEMIASISAINYGEFGFVGFYIVKPEFRGQGYGWQIWQHGLNYLAQCNVALDGVVEQQDNYRKSGFNLAHNNIRYQWKNQTNNQHSIISVNYQACSDEDLELFLSPYFPSNRSQFNKAWREQPNANTKVILKNNTIKALGVIRKCHEGYKIGPLFADNPEFAEQLMADLTFDIPDDELIFLDIPDGQVNVLPLLAKRNAEPVFETARMYTGKEPAIHLEHTYGITSFEIG